MPEKYHRYFPCKCIADLLDKGDSNCMCIPELLILEELDGKPVEPTRNPYRSCKYVVIRAETWCSRCWEYGCDKRNTHKQPAVIDIFLDEPPKAPSKASSKTTQTPKAKKTSRATKTSTKSPATPGTHDPSMIHPSIRNRFNLDPPLISQDPPGRGSGGFTPINSPGSRSGGFTPVNSPSARASRRRATAIRSTPQQTETPESTRDGTAGGSVVSSRGGTQPEHGYSTRRGSNRTATRS